MKQIIKVKLKKVVDNSYEILIGSGTIKKLSLLIRKIGRFSSIVIITDTHVKQLWGTKIIDSLNKVGCKTILLIFTAGEKNKNQATVSHLQSQMFKLGCNRNTLVVAFGGGVVGDVAGFVAATYMRGISYIQVPTTLLSMVDSSVGGKTGADTAFGKNLIGAFHQPKAVLIDFDFLKTLSKCQFINGLVEAIKIFLTSDAKMFKLVEDNLQKILLGDKKILSKVINRSVQLKAGIVERDEKESGERMVLNFGHTIGHALEAASRYDLLHGEAVALGIIAESRMSSQINLLGSIDAKRIEKLIKQLGIEANLLRKFNINKLINIMKSDKKGKGQFVLIENLGKVFVLNGEYTQKVDESIIKKVLN